MARLLLLLTILLVSCGDKGIERKLPPVEEIEPKTVIAKEPKYVSKWTYQPFEGIENCIDTIAFDRNDSGFYYACEQEVKLPINYTEKGGMIGLQLWGLTSDHHETPKLEVISKYTLQFFGSDELLVKDIEHLGADGFKKADAEFEKPIFKKVE